MNNKISMAQLQALIIISALGFEILILPSLISSIVELLVVLISSFALCLIATYTKADISKSKLLCSIYSIKNIIVIVLLIKILSNATGKVLLNNSGIFRITVFTLILAGYAAYMGIESIARIAQMLFWFILIGTIYVYAMTLPDIKLENIILFGENSSFIKLLLLGFILNTAEIIILVKPYVSNIKSEIIKGIVISLILVFLISFIIMGKIGIQGMKSIEYPFFEIMYTANTPNIFIKRQEGIFLSLWVISAFISIFIYFSTTVNYMKKLNIDKFFSILFIIVFTLIAVYIFRNINVIGTYCIIQAVGGFITVLIIPLIYIFKRRQ